MNQKQIVPCLLAVRYLPAMVLATRGDKHGGAFPDCQTLQLIALEPSRRRRRRVLSECTTIVLTRMFVGGEMLSMLPVSSKGSD